MLPPSTSVSSPPRQVTTFLGLSDAGFWYRCSGDPFRRPRYSPHRYHFSLLNTTDPNHGPSGDDERHKALTRDELLAWASSFGSATHAVIAMILDRNSAAVPRGLLQARNVLANLGKKHSKATLEPACQQVLEKKLAPTMAVIKRIQTDIAHAQQHPAAPGRRTQPATKNQQRPSAPLTGDAADAVFIRPADHYEN